MADYQIHCDLNPTPGDCRDLTAKLVAYNTQFIETDRIDRIAVFIRNNGGEIIGGGTGWVKLNCPSSDIVGLAEELRGKGVGREMRGQIEQMARRRGCDHVHLHPFDLQALG